MNDEMKEKLSAFIDDENHDNRLIDELLANDEAKSTLASYRIISDVMRHRYNQDATDLSARVGQALADEATIVSPARWFKPRKVMQQAAGLAVAATVAAVSILVVGDFSATQPEQEKIAVVGPITEQPIRMTSAVQKKLSGYLVSHNEFSASGKMQGILPYSRIATASANQRLVVQTGATLEK